MTTELNKKLEQVFNHLGDEKMNSAMRNMPVAKNDVLTFTGETEVLIAKIDKKERPYGVFKTVEGFDIPFSQIARKNNGLGINKATIKEAITEFASRIGEDGYRVTVEDIKKVESSFGEGKMTYIRFKVEA